MGKLAPCSPMNSSAFNRWQRRSTRISSSTSFGSYGYRIERGLNHAPEIKGYSAEYLRAESLRNAEIQRELKERGLSGAEAINNIKHQNREAKLNLTADELKALHKRNAAEFGDQPARVVAEAAEHHARTLSPEKIHDKTKAAVEFARERLSERSAVFEQFEVLRDALRHVQGKVRLPRDPSGTGAAAGGWSFRCRRSYSTACSGCPLHHAGTHGSRTRGDCARARRHQPGSAGRNDRRPRSHRGMALV